MINQALTGTPTSRRFLTLPAAQAAVLIAGSPILIGTMPCVLLDTYQSISGGATALFGGSFFLSVVAESDENSPPTGAIIKPGDKVYAKGTTDATTNVTYSLTINKDTGGTLFGNLDPEQSSIPSGTTNTQAVVVLPNGM